MAYQKELWLTNESAQREYEAVVNGVDFLDEHESENWPSEREYLQFKVIPEMIDHLVDDPANEGLVQKLLHARDLITDVEVGVAISDQEHKIDGVEFHGIDKRPDGSKILMILTRPNVVAGLESGDDRVTLISKFRKVFLQVSDEQRKLAKAEKFIPYSNSKV